MVPSTFKKAESEDALFVHLHETTGKQVTVRIEFEGCDPFDTELVPYELRTFKIKKSGDWAGCNLLKESIQMVRY